VSIELERWRCPACDSVFDVWVEDGEVEDACCPEECLDEDGEPLVGEYDAEASAVLG